jgi:Rad3-related DNA helicase
MIAEYKRRSTPSLRSRLYEVEELINGLGRVQYYSNKNWVCELFEGTEYGRVWKFDCIWPGYLAESKLWLKIQKIFVMSASLRPFDLKTLLNVPSDQLEFREWPRQFRAQDTPVYAVPARRPDGQKIRIVYHTQEDDLQLWVKRIDEIIEPRLGRKGIIHTVSFARQQYLVTHSRFARHFLVNRSRSESESAAAIADKYIHSEPPSILVSPSFDTGWDFPGDHCRWQIISKIAFPETKSKLMSRRKELSANYINSIAMRNLIQSSGRGSRSKLDWCEVFVVDGSASGFFYRNRNLAPRWFNLIEMNTVPKPMRSR